jgi:magnesium chelatase family protein
MEKRITNVWGSGWPEPHSVQITTRGKRGPGDLVVSGGSKASNTELKVRVLASLARAGMRPACQVEVEVLNAPSSASLDLATLLQVLPLCEGAPELDPALVDSTAFVAELGLGGQLHPVRGLVGILEAYVARGITRALVAPSDAADAVRVDGCEVYTAADVNDVLAYLRGEQLCPSQEATRLYRELSTPESIPLPPALQQAASAIAGGRSMLWTGVGNGGTLAAREAARLMRAPNPKQALDIARVYSAAGMGNDAIRRPFRAPHHTVSMGAMLGTHSRPGEVQLARHGVLVLDQVHEFSMAVIRELHRADLSEVTIVATIPEDAKVRPHVAEFLLSLERRNVA